MSCRVAAKFHKILIADQVVLAKNSPISQDAWATLALKIADAYRHLAHPNKFALGPPVPDSQKMALKKMLALSETAGVSIEKGASGGSYLLPLPDEAKRFLYWGGWEYDTVIAPLVVDGHAYLISRSERRSNSVSGSDELLVLYDLKNDKLDSVAATLVREKQGPLTSLHVSDTLGSP